jgi:hypothetical protein
MCIARRARLARPELFMIEGLELDPQSNLSFSTWQHLFQSSKVR